MQTRCFTNQVSEITVCNLEYLNMAEKKNPDKVRICVDITTEQHELVKKYNEKTSKPLMLSRVCSLAIEREIEIIKKEMEERENSEQNE